MQNDSTDQYENRSLNDLLNDWQEGKLNEQEKDYVISKVPIMGYIDRNKDYRDIADRQKH